MKTHSGICNIDKLLAVCVHQEGKSQTNITLPALWSPGGHYKKEGGRLETQLKSACCSCRERKFRSWLGIG